MPIFALRTTSNREDQVVDFVSSNAQKKVLPVYSIIRPHGLRAYIFLEAETREAAEEAYHKVPYARGLLPNLVEYKEIEHMLEQVKVQVNIKKMMWLKLSAVHSSARKQRSRELTKQKKK